MSLPALIAKPSIPESLELTSPIDSKFLFHPLVYSLGDRAIKRAFNSASASCLFEAIKRLADISASARFLSRKVEDNFSLGSS